MKRIIKKLAFVAPIILVAIFLAQTATPMAAADLPGEPIERHPTGFLDFTGDWTRVGGDHGWDCVDEYPPDDADYIKAGSDNDVTSYMLFRYASFNAPNYTDANVTIYYRARDNAWAGDRDNNIQSALQIGGTRYQAGSHNPPGTNIFGEGDFTTYSYTWSVNPATNQEWTGAEITQIQGFGVYTNDAFPVIRVSAVWMVISFTYATPYVKFEYANPHQSEAYAGEMSFGVVLTNPSANTITVNYSVAPGSATPGEDYNASSGTVTFLPGETRKTVRGIYHLDDRMYEGPETVLFTLSNPVNALMGSITTATWTIDEDDPEVFLSVSAEDVNEGNSGSHTVPVTVNIWPAASSSPVSVNYATADGTAVGSGSLADYTAVSGTLNFAPGETSKTINITVSGDRRYESDEYFWLNLSNFVGASLNYYNPGGVLLYNDDSPPVINEFVADHVGNDLYEFIEIYGAPSTNYADFKILCIENDPGQNPGVIDRIYTVGTTDAQGFWRTPFLNNELENGSFILLMVTGFTGTLSQDLDTNNDQYPEIQPWNTLLEFDGVAIYNPAPVGEFFYPWPSLFDVGGGSRLPNGSGGWVKDDFDGAGLTGFAGSPTAAEALNTPGLVNARCSGPPTVQFASATSSGSEAAAANLTVNLTPASATTVTVQYSVIGGGTASGGGVDYILASGTLTFTPGVTSANIPINITNDVLDEPNETIVVGLYSPVNAVLDSPASHTYTINDDDSAPSLSVNDVTVAEGVNAVFTVTLSAASAYPVSVHYDTIEGAARIGSDCYMTLGVLNFTPGGPLSHTITVQTVNDSTHEEDETFTVRLSSPSYATVSKQDGICTITDNDAVALYTVTFEAGSHGSLSGTTNFPGIPNDTAWASAVTVPTPVPAEHYHFVNWTPAFPSTVTSSVTYTANFAIDTRSVGFSFIGLPPSVADETVVLTVTIGDTSPVSVVYEHLGQTFSNIPYGTSVSFAYVSPVVNTIPGFQHSWIESSGTGGAFGQVGQTGTFSLTGNASVLARYDTEYRVTYVSSPSGLTVPADEWVKSGDIATGTFTSPQSSGGDTIKYTFVSDNRPATITGPRTITGTFNTQYYLTVNNGGHGNAGGQGWYDAGSAANATISSTTITEGATRFVFTGWSGDAVGLNATSNAIIMNGPKTATAAWKMQYQVTFAQSGIGGDAIDAGVVSVNGNTKIVTQLPFSDWYDTDATITFAYNSPITVDFGKRYVWVSTSGITTAQNGNISPLPGTIVATYKTQYYLTVDDSGLSDPVGEGWYDAGTITQAAISDIWIHDTARGFSFNGWSGDASGTGRISNDIEMNGPKTATAMWTPYYRLTIGTTSGTTSPEPGNHWLVAGTKLTITATPASTAQDERYVFSGWMGSGSGSYTGADNPAIDAVTMNGPITQLAYWTHQYQLTIAQSGLDSSIEGKPVTMVMISSPLLGPIILTGNFGSMSYWADEGATLSYNFFVPHCSVAGKQFVLDSVTGPASFYTVNAAAIITGNFTAQYYLTVNNSGHGTAGGAGWYNAGSNAQATINPTTVTDGGTRYIFNGWTGNASGAGSPSTNIVMDGPKTATATWTAQYYLTVNNSGHGTAGGDGWYNAGTTVQATINPTTVVDGSTRYIFTAWTGDASGTGAASTNINMNSPKTATATWTTQYQVTFTQTGITSGAGANTVLTVGTTDYAYDELPSAAWFDSGTEFIWTTPVDGTTGERFVRGYQSLNSPITAAGTYSASYRTQYLITFAQTGLDNTATGVVVEVRAWRPSPHGSQIVWQETLSSDFSDTSYWVDDSFEISYQYHSVIASSSVGKQFVRTSGDDPTSMFHPDSPVTITGNYTTQYSLTVDNGGHGTVSGDGWYNAGTNVQATISPTTVTDGSTRYFFTGWSGDASGTGPVSNDITMNSPKTTTAVWAETIDQTITFDALAGKTYGDIDFTVNAAASSGLPVTFTAEGECTIVGNVVHITGAGTGTITAHQAGNETYNPAADASRSFTINPKTATVTADNKTKTYGDDSPPLTAVVSGTVGSDTLNYGLSTTAMKLSGVGSYPITVHLSSNPNYSVTPANGNLTVEKAPVTIAIDNKVKTYGEDNPPFTAVVTGAVPGGNPVDYLLFTEAGKYASPTTGGYTIIAVLGPNANYNVTVHSGTLTINQADAVINVSGWTGTYDGASHGATGTARGIETSPFSPANLDGLLHFGNGFTNVPGGTTHWTFSGNTNYKPASGDVAITILPKPASVTPDAATKVYGSVDPTLTGTVFGFLEADGVTAAYSRAAGETVAGSPYTISAVISPASALSNYNITYGTASFSITPKAASVTPNAATKVYGANDPALTGSLFGFLAADNVTANYSRAAGETVAGSPYTISAVLSPAGVMGNYNITYNSADFTIKVATVTVLYNGDQIVKVGDSFIAKAQITGPNAASINNKKVCFFLDDDPIQTGLQLEWQIGFALTNSSGLATLAPISTADWEPGVYTIIARTDDTNVSLSQDEATFTLASPGDAASGGGWYTQSGIGRINFGFNVAQIPNTDPIQYKGQIVLINNGKWRLKGELNSYVCVGTSGAATGIGKLYRWDATLNGGLGGWTLADANVSFTISFADLDAGGGTGKGKTTITPDTFTIHIDFVVGAADPVLPNTGNPMDLKGGNIDIKGFTETPGETNDPTGGKGGGKK